MFDQWIYSYRFRTHQVQAQTPGKQTETGMRWNEVPIFFSLSLSLNWEALKALFWQDCGVWGNT